jgi:peroxiredoxin
MRKYFLFSVFTFLWSLSATFAQNTTPQPDPAYQEQIKAGQASVAAGNYKAALDIFKKLNKLHNDACAACDIGMAAAYIRMAQFDNAVAASDRAVSVADNSGIKATAHSFKGTAILSRDGDKEKNLRDAEAEYRAAVELDKTEPIYHFNLATTLLRQSKDDEAKNELTKCLALRPSQSLTEQANRLIVDPRRARLNFAPEFHLMTLQGQDLSLEHLRGNIVVLDFWATWCPPCRASVSELKDLTRKYANAKVVLISVSGDKDEKAWREFVAKKNMDWPQYRDTNSSVISSFAVNAFPTYLVIDGDGIIKQRITGMNPQESVVHRLKDTLRDMPQLEGIASK